LHLKEDAEFLRAERAREHQRQLQEKYDAAHDNMDL
jgi:hypothetical protein